MELANVIGGGPAYITNVAVFSSTAIVDGAMLVSGASTTAQGAAVTVTLDTTDGLNFIGVSQISSSFATQHLENLSNNANAYHIATSGFPVRGTITGLCYLPTCLNHDATYFALYSTTTGAATASDTVGTWTASTITAVQRGTTGLDVLGGWIFTLAGNNSAGTVPTFSGSLRYISNQSATTHITLLTAINISTDCHAIWMDRTFKKSGILNSTGDKLRSTSGSSGTGFQLNGTHMTRLENYIKHDQAPTHPVRQFVDDGLDTLTGVELKSEIVFTQPFLCDVA